MQIKIEIIGLLAGILATGFEAVRIILWYSSGYRIPELFPGWPIGGIVLGILFISGLGSLVYQVYNFVTGRRALWGIRIPLALIFLFLISFNSAPLGR